MKARCKRTVAVTARSKTLTAGKNAPVVFWHSDPVRPDDTVMLQGAFPGGNLWAEAMRPDDAAALTRPTAWRKINPALGNRHVLQFTIPRAWPMGLYRCRVAGAGGVSAEVCLNAPDVWWMQGAIGLEWSAGGPLRLFGKCLNFGGVSRVRLTPRTPGRVRTLAASRAGCYELGLTLPADLRPGEYAVQVHNGLGGQLGWRNAGCLHLAKVSGREPKRFNVVNYGADPYACGDATAAVRRAIRAAEPCGGEVYFPRGRYILNDMLVVPRGVALRGEGMEVVNLFWPDAANARMARDPRVHRTDRGTPRPSALLLRGNTRVADVSLYLQGLHPVGIIGFGDRIALHRVRLRAHPLYGLNTVGHERWSRRIDRLPGDAYGVSLQGNHLAVTDCDIYIPLGVTIEILHCRGGVVARNTLQTGGGFYYGCRELVVEDNDTIGCTSPNINRPTTDPSMHVFMGRNRIRHSYNGDREGMTLDGHGTAYVGVVRSATDSIMTLSEAPDWRTTGRSCIPHWQGAYAAIVAGTGAGQYRWIKDCVDCRIEVAAPWQVPPDKNSTIVIGKFNGRSLFIGNQVSDTGAAFQLYAPSIENIVAGNETWRTGNYNMSAVVNYDKPTWGGLASDISWRNQFLDNTIREGNQWGAGLSVTDYWIGGGTVVNIYGFNSETRRPFPPSRCQVVRRHRAWNNSAMRIAGAVEGVLIEHCRLQDHCDGIEVDSTIERYMAGSALTQYAFRNFFPKANRLILPPEPHGSQPLPKAFRAVNTPRQILLRGNRMDDIDRPYFGNALRNAKIEN